MMKFEAFHPAVILIYHFLILMISMFSYNPVLLVVSFAGSFFFCIMLLGVKKLFSSLLFFVPAGLLLALTNPLFSQNGENVLFTFFGLKYTLESLLYGIMLSFMLLSVMLWCTSLSNTLTNDKLMYLFGRILPKITVVLSMALRFIPLFVSRIKKISTAQKTTGLYPQAGLSEKARGAFRVFTAIVTMSLENAVDTGDSMKARGYGEKKRTSFSVYRFQFYDILLLFTILLLFALTVCAGLISENSVAFPTAVPASSASALSYFSFGLLAFLPFIINLAEVLTWKYFISKA